MCITVKQMMQIEENGHQMGFSRKFMMENAGAATVKRIKEKYGMMILEEGILVFAGLGNLPGVALSGMGLGVFEEFADYILGTEFRIGAVFMLLVLILVYRRFVLSRKREYLK